MGRLLCGGALNQRAMRDDPHDLQVIGRKGRAVRDSLISLTPSPEGLAARVSSSLALSSRNRRQDVPETRQARAEALRSYTCPVHRGNEC